MDLTEVLDYAQWAKDIIKEKINCENCASVKFYSDTIKREHHFVIKY